MRETSQRIAVYPGAGTVLSLLEHRFFLCIPLVLLASLSFAGLERHALWNDEAFSYFVSWHGPAESLRLIHFDSQPPLYYLLLSLWLKAGDSVALMRSLSAVAIVLSMVPAYFGTVRLLGIRAANLAALLFAVNPSVISWADAARPYALQVLFVSVSFWGFARLWSAPTFERRIVLSGLSGRVRRSGADLADEFAWLAYAVGGGAAMLVQYPAGFFVLACNLAILVRLLIRPARKTLLINWVIANLVLIAVFSLWSQGMVGQFSQHLSPEEIALKHRNYLITASDMFANLERIFSIAFLWRLRAFFFTLYAGLFILGAVFLYRRRMVLPMLVLAAVPPAVCVAGFYLLHPLLGYVIYTFIWLQPIIIAVVAFGLGRLPLALRAACVAVLLAGNAWGIANYFGASRVPLDEVAAAMRPSVQQGDGAVLSSDASMRWGIAYYLGEDRRLVDGLDVTELGRDKLIRSLDDALRYRRIWVAVPHNETPAVPLAAIRQHAHGEWHTSIGAVDLYRFDL